jgi:hypothetical protein
LEDPDGQWVVNGCVGCAIGAALSRNIEAEYFHSSGFMSRHNGAAAAG